MSVSRNADKAPHPSPLDDGGFLPDVSVVTEIKDKSGISPAVERFILQWGEMGSQWGVNRSVAQIHALLYVSAKPLTAEAIAATLAMARSNVSNSLKELVAWDLVHRVPVLGDRREHFAAETDVWEIAIRIAKGRKQREIDPAVTTLKASLEAARADRATDPVAIERLGAMLDFTDSAETWMRQMLAVPKSRLERAMRLGAKVFALLPGGKNR
jgi:DNA-binding transcriptional regulator GbsR (MarR family)